MISPAIDMGDWQRHQAECAVCRGARYIEHLCPIGQNFWRPPAQQAPAAPPPQVSALARMADNIATGIATRAVAQTSSGLSIAVPMEKRSREVAFATSENVVLRMPERDIEVYAAMKEGVRRLLIFADAVARLGQVVDATARDLEAQTISSDERALVLAQVGARFGVHPADVYAHLADLEPAVLRLGDRMGAFMRVDDDTRRVMRTVRGLGLDLRGALEASMDGQISSRVDLRDLARQCRLCALDLQSEIERRLGT